MTHWVFLIIWLLVIVVNLYMARVNTNTYYRLIAKKMYGNAKVAQWLVVMNLMMAVGISVGVVWYIFLNH